LGRLREEYVNAGKVRFVYKHFAILGPESNRAAEASECAAEQEQFWAFHDLVFEDQNSSRSTLSDERLIALAANIGLDAGDFGECLESGRYTDQIRQESLSVQSMGVRGTPGFLINGIFISGAQPYEVFQQIIEEQLQAQ
jgi:protein-disulfide isomerase